MRAEAKAKRSIWSSLGRALLAVLSILYGLGTLASHNMRTREISRDEAHARERSRWLSTVVLTDTLAPSVSGLVLVDEAWVEEIVQMRYGLFPYKTGSRYLVLRLRAEHRDAGLIARASDWPRDTLMFTGWFRAPRNVQIAFGPDTRFPDTLVFVPPPSERRSRRR